MKKILSQYSRIRLKRGQHENDSKHFLVLNSAMSRCDSGCNSAPS
jgi:hypothetical protein